MIYLIIIHKYFLGFPLRFYLYARSLDSIYYCLYRFFFVIRPCRMHFQVMNTEMKSVFNNNIFPLYFVYECFDLKDWKIWTLIFHFTDIFDHHSGSSFTIPTIILMFYMYV